MNNLKTEAAIILVAHSMSVYSLVHLVVPNLDFTTQIEAKYPEGDLSTLLHRTLIRNARCDGSSPAVVSD